ncbi:MAG TPA: DEAD/DEAH box helicase [Nitrososphaerales archaeon]|nr:DEAD/DEAH box helicase [Nitrososphaerales archaeon]
MRTRQSQVEANYLESSAPENKTGSALELASLYHLAKTVELLTEYMLRGTPNDVTYQLDFHFTRSLKFSDRARLVEFDILLRMLNYTFLKMINNSIWTITKKVNSRVTKFANSITKSDKPIFELLYPQRVTILEKGLLDPASKAIVVNLPTSSGKTMIAEFRILQALNQFSDLGGWIAYVAPTRALVNQLTVRLRKDLGPLEIGIEKMSGAIEIDSFEEKLLTSKDAFDILVVTPEKLNLLIRQGVESKLGRPLCLVVIDEAHNLAEGERGINLEMLVSVIKKDCTNANLLLLTPFIPNSRDIATWLDPQNPRSISVGLNWEPNDRVIGLYYGERERGKVTTFYRPLITSPSSSNLNFTIPIGECNFSKETVSKIISTKFVLSSVVAKQLSKSGNVLVLSNRVDGTWATAKQLASLFPKINEVDKRLDLVCRFVAAELGEHFPLVDYLRKGIGVHNSGLPDDVKFLIESLMEEGLLKVLVSTTTIAQGINFPVSAILLTSYMYPVPNPKSGKTRTEPMPARDFGNLIGRTGRIDQRSTGIIGIAVRKSEPKDLQSATKFVKRTVEDLVSVLVKMVNDASKLGKSLNLSELHHNPEWSTFLQYIAHMYKQSQNLDNFLAEVEITLKRTYGYDHLEPPKKQLLLQAVKEYAQNLDKNKDLATLSDMTGFSPETLQQTMQKVKGLQIDTSEWKGSRLFGAESSTLSKLVGVMLKDIPEIKNQLNIFAGRSDTSTKIAQVISDWVAGTDIITISKRYFGGTDIDSVTDCVRALYGKVSNFATWGLAAIEKLPDSGADSEKLSPDETRKLRNLPAMIYYGVGSDEAILMRMNNVPRSISQRLGEMYKEKIGDVYASRIGMAGSWLKELKDNEWTKAIPSDKNMSGSEYKQVWQFLSGYESKLISPVT